MVLVLLDSRGPRDNLAPLALRVLKVSQVTPASQDHKGFQGHQERMVE